ncbi:E3 ubiquitin-protein ligase RGLG2 [Camellia lanceoleosa]|uniref:E3 ubiquitin-protein ligase RGLG2 n=1 Tax=Camellia lanceoleosa TaxID=1840588 RepID=A0ACC0HV60_9ERIC|nr:E3 ubiquitin-protein ligase RGLG2 [Camellia lanceoleosa]
MASYQILLEIAQVPFLLFAASNCQIMGHIPRGISYFENLNALYLDNNGLTGTIPSTIGKLQSLQRLFVDGNKMEGIIPNELCLLKKLGELSLQNNSFPGSIPPCIGNISLLLGSNALNLSIPVNFGSLENLIVLNLSSNNFGESLPLNIGKLEVIENMDLSWNKILGNISPFIGAFQRLSSLNMSRNSFEGTIPQSFGDLIALESIDLSYNNLFGSIPKSLEKLRDLLANFNPNPNPNLSSRLRVGSLNSGSGGSVLIDCLKNKEGGVKEEENQENKNVDVGGVETSFGEIVLEFEVIQLLARNGVQETHVVVAELFFVNQSLPIRSLHCVGSGLNPYEQATSIIGKTLAAFDEDNLIPCYGLGDASTHDQDVFRFYPDDRPTSFGPIIEMAMTIVEKSGGQYHVLLIIANGQVKESKFVFEARIIQRMELLVLSTLQWKMNSLTPLSFVDHIVRRFGLKTDLHLEFLWRCMLTPQELLVKVRAPVVPNRECSP